MMPPVDPEHIETAKTAGTWMGAAMTFFATMFGAKNAIDKRIGVVDKKVDEKASVLEVNRVRDSVATLFTQQRQDKADMLNSAKEDKKQIIDAISGLTGQFQAFRGDVIAEFGKRPDRNETAEIARTLYQASHPK